MILKTEKDVFGLLVRLSYSQGYYGRLLRELNSVPDNIRHEFLNHFIDKSDIDMILEIEGG